MKTFNPIQLLMIAQKAVELCGMKMTNNPSACEHPYQYWQINSMVDENRFDYIPYEPITLDMMLAYEELRKWIELAYDCPMTLYIGTRGAYEDAEVCICIEPTENLTERKNQRAA